MLENIIVIKKGGREEPFDVEKLHKVVNFACEGLSGTSPSAVAIGSRARLQGTTKITTSDITKILIHSASVLIDEHSANYQYVAGRLMNYDLRKQVYGSFEVPSLYSIIKKNVEDGWYDKDVLEKYTQEEIDYLCTKLNHHRDETYTYAAWKQLNSKYLVRDRNSGNYKESPQIMYMLIAMTLFSKVETSIRLQRVVNYYNKTSGGHKSLIGLPTPILGGVRTPTRQFSSCVVIKEGDSLDSINATSEACVNYVAKRAGIGIDMGRLRPLGSTIRNGEATHTGITPFTKHNQTAVGSASQGGIRSGAATTFFPVFHQEIESIIVFKNNRGTEENRVRHLDYGIAINTHFYKLAIGDQPYNLFNANEVPDLYEAFYKDPEVFESLYNKYSKDPTKSKVKVSAKELFDSIVTERAQTGRIYIFNVDNANKQSAFKSTIYQSNLCLEISIPTHDITKLGTFKVKDIEQFGMMVSDTKDIKAFHERFGEIGLCTLSNINMGMMRSPSDLEEACKYAVYALDELLDYQDYPLIAAEIPAKSRRNLGLGLNNLAYFLAKNKIKYGESLEFLDEYMEAMYFYSLKASVELAKEKGACEWYHDTIYADGKFIWELRNPNVDDIVPMTLRLDWEGLREDIKKYGVRNSTLIAHMPSESNSLLMNATNGVEPIREKVVTKGNKDDNYKQVVPNVSLKYDMLWDMDVMDYLKTMAVIQKWTDQAISANASYDPEKFEDEKIPFNLVKRHVLTAQKFGLKTLYYHNTKVNEYEDDCETCKL